MKGSSTRRNAILYTGAVVSTWPVRWSGRWIWWRKGGETTSPYPEARPDEIGYLRRAFDLEDPVPEARARVSANSRFVLFVNGNMVGRGPIRSEPLNSFYDSYELGPLLRPGRNVIAAWCRYYGEPKVFWTPSVPAGQVGLGWFVFETTGGLSLSSGADWKALAAPYREHTPGLWQRGQPRLEILDGGLVPAGWTEASFDDTSWPDAVVLEWRGLGVPVTTPPADPHPRMRSRPIPQLTDEIIRPARIAGGGTAAYELTPDPLGDFNLAHTQTAGDQDGLDVKLEATEFVTFDFGRITRASPRLEVNAEQGVVIDLACGEDLAPDGRPVIAPREWAMRYHGGGADEEEVESFEAIGYRYLMVRSSAPARISVEARESHYPRPEGAFFRCDDEVLNRIWETGVRTLDLCSTDSFVDCPGREQRAWVGDGFLTSLVSFVANPDTRLVKRTLRLHAEAPRPDGLLPAAAACDFALRPSTIPDFSLLWIRALRCVWDYTGDESLVDELLPKALPILRFFEEFRGDDDRLTDVPGWVFIDWAQIERGPNTAALDALYILALEDFAALASARGLRKWSSLAREMSRRSKRAFQRYWDGSKGVYVDAVGRVSQQTNSLAILAGCAPRSRWKRMLEYVLDPARVKITKTPGDSMEWSERLTFQWSKPNDFDEGHDVVAAQPFFCHFLHQALVLAGRRDDLIPMLHRWEPQLRSGNGCFEEYWSAPPGGGSRCHVWAATPVYDATTHLLGVRPASPGFTEVVVEPFFGPLRHLEGRVPTPHGFIEVDLTLEDGRVSKKISVPDGVTLKE